MKQELVKNWMTQDVITISPKTSLPEAHIKMTGNGIRRLPVMKDGKLVGIITRGDVREAEPSEATTLTIWEINYLLSKLQVKKIMRKKVVTIPPDATIGEVAKLMLEHKISGLPVVDKRQKIIGIITESDIFRLVVNTWSAVE